jgi:excisionase family DNA binding protein
MNAEQSMRSLVMYTPNEVAAMLKLARTKVYALLMDGSIFSVKIGKSRRIPASAYAEFVARLQEEALQQGTVG